MKIFIQGVRRAPSWETLQTMLSEMLGKDGVIIRIQRRDGGCDYRKLGTYDIDFRTDFEVVTLEMEVS